MSFDRIALISEDYPPYIIGGTGTFCYELARVLSGRGIATTVFCGRSKKLNEEKANDFLDIIRMPCFDFPPRFAWFQLQNFGALSRRLGSQTIIHSITPEISPLCIHLKKKLNKRLITSYHGVTRYEMRSFVNVPMSHWTAGEFVFHILELPLYDASNRLSVNNSDHIVSCSLSILNELRSTYTGLDMARCSVIPNGIDLAKFDGIKDRVREENERDATLINFGRLYWLKGATYALKACELLLRDYPKLILKIFGAGPMEHRLRELASGTHLKGKIQVLGQIPHDKLLVEITKAEVVVLPSFREAQPIGVLEAMACRKPVVAFDFPFVHEYIRDSFNGLLAKPGDSKDLAEKIRMLLDDDSLKKRLGQTAYEHVRLHHNWDTIADKYIQVYQKVARLE